MASCNQKLGIEGIGYVRKLRKINSVECLENFNELRQQYSEVEMYLEKPAQKQAANFAELQQMRDELDALLELAQDLWNQVAVDKRLGINPAVIQRTANSALTASEMARKKYNALLEKIGDEDLAEINS